MNDDPTAVVRKLAERLKEEAAKVGLTLRGFSFVPSLEGGPDGVQAVFSIDDAESLNKDAEQAQIDAQFEQIMKGDATAKREEKVNEARETLRRRLEGKEGFLDD